jgi:NDP-sugar pyrophosphorylase family protein
MQGVILAAGKGTRLHPITLQRSKAMAPVAGKPMVERVVDVLVANGVHQLIMLIGPQDDEIMPYFRRLRPELDLRFVVQHERLGMAHALGLAAPYLQGDFVLSACDNLTPVEHVGELIATHRQRRANATLSLMPIDIRQSASTGIVDWQAGRVRRIIEKPQPAEAPSNISSLPLYVFGTHILDLLPHVQPSVRGEYELQEAIQMLIDQAGGVTGVLTDRRIQLTNAADLLALNRHFLSANGGNPQVWSQQIGAGTQLAPPIRIEADVTIGPDCVIGPHVYIEAGSRIGARVHLSDVVVLRGAIIEDDRTCQSTVINTSLQINATQWLYSEQSSAST